MAASSTTRHGNGAGYGYGKGPGWGGPKRGVQETRGERAAPFTRNNAVAMLENDDPDEQAYRAKRRKDRRERRDLAERVLQAEAVKAKESRDRTNAADRLLTHLGPEQPSRVELSGPEGSALKVEAIRRVIIDPRNPNS